MALELDLQVATQHRPVPAVAEFQTWASAALEPGSNAVLTIRIVDAEESRQLNQAYRGKDKPTNVLSFNAELPPEVDIPLLGDVIICAPVVASEAASQGKPDTAHWAHLTIHGILHLLGMDHEEADDAQRMEHKEIEILASLGIANPYN